MSLLVDWKAWLADWCSPSHHPHGLLIEIGKLASVTCVQMLSPQAGLKSPEKD